jgi:hypothetical protein
LRGMGQLCVELPSAGKIRLARSTKRGRSPGPGSSSVFGFSHASRGLEIARGDFVSAAAMLRDGAISSRTITRVRCAG